MLLFFCPLFRALPMLLLGCAAPLVHAAALTVTVSGDDGRPLPDAVVMLEPVSGKLSVKPLPQVEISQVQRQFSPQLTVITVGTAVNFPNRDSVRHQVYSFSPIKTLEIKLYAGVPSAPVVFDKPGTAVLGCNIHDQMVAWVVVVDTPYYARTTPKGQARIEGITAGNYRLHAWHAGVAPGQESAPVAITVAAADAKADLHLAASAP